MGYHQKEDDDDLWSCRQVQELLGLWSTDPQERGHHVHDEGSWRQHSERCCRSWCARWLRQVQVCLHSMENVPGIIWVLLSSLYSSHGSIPRTTHLSLSLPDNNNSLVQQEVLSMTGATLPVSGFKHLL